MDADLALNALAAAGLAVERGVHKKGTNQSYGRWEVRGPGFEVHPGYRGNKAPPAPLVDTIVQPGRAPRAGGRRCSTGWQTPSRLLTFARGPPARPSRAHPTRSHCTPPLAPQQQRRPLGPGPGQTASMSRPLLAALVRLVAAALGGRLPAKLASRWCDAAPGRGRRSSGTAGCSATARVMRRRSATKREGRPRRGN